jgi:dihydroneopterin aldolase
MPNPNVAPFPAPEPAYGEARIHVRDLVLKARIGVHQHERLAYQRIRLNLELTVDYATPLGDDLENVLCYATLVTGIRGVVGARHVNLIETLADDIARM